MLRRAFFLLFTIVFFVGIIWLFRAPSRDLYIRIRPSSTKTQQRTRTSSIGSKELQTAVQVQTDTSSIRLFETFRKVQKLFPKHTVQKLAQLDRTTWLVGVPDGVRPHEHTLSGHRVLQIHSDGSWKPFLKGRSIFRIRVSKRGWLATVTTHNHLLIRSPQGKWQTLNRRTGGQPQFSPSGRYLVHVHRQSIAHHTLLWRDTQTGKEHALASRGPISDPVVSPDEQSVIYVSGRTGIVSFWKTDRAGHHTQLTHKGLAPGQGRPVGFIPTPTGRYPVLWAGTWLVYDGGEALWALREDGTQSIRIASGQHIPRWKIPGKSVEYTVKKQKRTYVLPD